MKNSDLIGVWKLFRYESFHSINNEIVYPYGEDATGYLIYTSDNYMSINIMRSGRSQQKLDVNNSNNISKIEMANNYGGYAGKYEIVSDHLFHYPEVCKFISYINVPQKKRFYFSDNKLVIDYWHPISEDDAQESNGHGRIERSKLFWERSQ